MKPQGREVPNDLRTNLIQLLVRWKRKRNVAGQRREEPQREGLFKKTWTDEYTNVN